MTEQFIPVKVLSDGDGHNYVVPNELSERFDGLLESMSWAEHEGRVHDYNKYEREFENEFSKYRTGGSPNNYQLFISQDELKRLTQ